jgi:5-formyltetrahydrofolate cyclo-ligase
MTKSELRRSCLAKRQLLPVDEHELASAHIAVRFFQVFDLSKIKVLHCFVSVPRFGEVDTRPIFQRVWSEFPDVETVVPRINHGRNELESLRYGPDTELTFNRWQIGEPVHQDRVEAAEIDIVLVPLLCFDRCGHRVGYGKGYYDRLLARCRTDCQKVGLSTFPPIDEITDAHESDIRLDTCITPTKVFNFAAMITLPQ